MAYGGWALAKNGDSAGKNHLDADHVLSHDRYSSAAVGATSLAVGGALALAGVLLLLTDAKSEHPQPVATSSSGMEAWF